MREKDEIVKTEILEQAQKLFHQYGLKKTTMDEIAAACGKAKSTLYHYFTSKEEVFDAVIEMELTNLRKQVKDKVEQQKSITDKLKTYMVEFQKGSLCMANVYRIMNDANYEQRNTKERFCKMMEFEKSYLQRILFDAYDSGECRNLQKDDLPLMAELFLAGYFGTVKYMILTAENYDPEKLERMAEIFTSKLFE
ncbi:TetR family transcriptional regulator [Mangrovibacterium diazotrophicum]|uniref:TetR family transcriptional regulator n=1 Tax=Mangrovibacterium diazotrophicum TaxID=1261403 RepID=A0A419VUT5_9BACT|nr:TetR family transcriptional regulator [Mangrovibacterium diazotrophicum]